MTKKHQRNMCFQKQRGEIALHDWSPRLKSMRREAAKVRKDRGSSKLKIDKPRARTATVIAAAFTSPATASATARNKNNACMTQHARTHDGTDQSEHEVSSLRLVQRPHPRRRGKRVLGGKKEKKEKNVADERNVMSETKTRK